MHELQVRLEAYLSLVLSDSLLRVRRFLKIV